MFGRRLPQRLLVFWWCGVQRVVAAHRLAGGFLGDGLGRGAGRSGDGGGDAVGTEPQPGAHRRWADRGDADPAGTPASAARVSIRRAKAIFVANRTCSGTPAAAQRAGSRVQQRQVDLPCRSASARSTAAWSPGANIIVRVDGPYAVIDRVLSELVDSPSRLRRGLAGAVRGDRGPVTAAGVAEALGPVLRQIDHDAAAARVLADPQAAQLPVTDDVDERHRGCDGHPRGEWCIGWCGVQVVRPPIVPDELWKGVVLAE